MCDVSLTARCQSLLRVVCRRLHASRAGCMGRGGMWQGLGHVRSGSWALFLSDFPYSRAHGGCQGMERRMCAERPRAERRGGTKTGKGGRWKWVAVQSLSHWRCGSFGTVRCVQSESRLRADAEGEGLWHSLWRRHVGPFVLYYREAVCQRRVSVRALACVAVRPAVTFIHSFMPRREGGL